MSRAILVLMFLTPACGAEAELGGSISELLDLEFDELVIVRQENALRVEYRRFLGDAVEIPCKLVIDTAGLHRGTEIELEAQTFHERVRLERVVLAGGDFPGVRATAGRLWIDHLALGDFDTVSGEFDALFINGRMLYGSFEGTVEPPRPEQP